MQPVAVRRGEINVLTSRPGGLSQSKDAQLTAKGEHIRCDGLGAFNVCFVFRIERDLGTYDSDSHSVVVCVAGGATCLPSSANSISISVMVSVIRWYSFDNSTIRPCASCFVTTVRSTSSCVDEARCLLFVCLRSDSEEEGASPLRSDKVHVLPSPGSAPVALNVGVPKVALEGRQRAGWIHALAAAKFRGIWSR